MRLSIFLDIFGIDDAAVIAAAQLPELICTTLPRVMLGRETASHAVTAVFLNADTLLRPRRRRVRAPRDATATVNREWLPC